MRERGAAFLGALAGAIVALLLAGCAAPQSAALRASAASASMAAHAGRAVPPAAARAIVDGVPFVAQSDYECGPAALAMALAAAGRPVALQDLVEAVYLPARKGSLQADRKSVV